MSGGFFLKPASATLDYGFLWDAGYLAGRAVAESVWAAEPAPPAGVAIVAEAVEGGTTSCTVSGGTAGAVVRLRNRVTLSDGLVDERSHTLLVREGR